MQSVVYFLLAAALAVPLFKRLGLGAILGYLVAGVVIGPQVLGLIGDPEKVLHLSEIGVILLLFVIGLELEPAKLWAMRSQVLLLGTGQLAATAAVVYAVLVYLFEMKSNGALVIALALGLSSTAFAVQLMADKGMLGNEDGRRGFSILLFQDLAVVPILFVVQAVAPVELNDKELAWWIAPTTILGLVVFARFLINPILNLLSRYGGREIMTVVALLIVLGAATIMEKVQLSMGLGAFMAGLMLANSSFRHQLEADVEPFKGLSLGLFFISIGLTLDLKLLAHSPITVAFGTLGLMALKTTVIIGLVMLARVPFPRALMLGLMLCQGGEFGFVIMAQAAAQKLLPASTADMVNLMVGLSMALTAPAVLWFDRFTDKQIAKDPQQQAKFDSQESEVLILGFGRFGQVTGRILAANQIRFTALDKDADHIEFVKKFGNLVYFGDAARREVIEAAGISRVRVVVVAIDEPQTAKNLVEYIATQYPKLTIIARAHNRVDYVALKKAGAHHVIRELFGGALEAATDTLNALGYSDGAAIRAAEVFRKHDEDMLNRLNTVQDDPAKLIELGLKGRQELEDIFRQDQTIGGRH
ncbi:monovalent cation:proton antiporter-2 (CPA2) family protein [Limnobacter humi]|uniref:Monovalent cation:proton antiporter-2 (CPA2) family protein n=1 Tax=Limnobacter humi TaxID=1778671 RepID=A0ABT1WHD9_9BURK|nr:monovalent cation:proton antiporter-2 (CPA2) family protein [Limnobacter humi]MCQ8896137.1 monovalent cation:proton antiporter-2 (CPA2) family protein [Limnobacter humi]